MTATRDAPPGTLFGRKPVVIQTLVFAVLNLLVAFDVVTLTASQLGAINAVVAALLGVWVGRVVTPLSDPKDRYGRRLVPQAEPNA